MIRVGAHFDGENLRWVAVRDRKSGEQLLGSENIPAPTLEYAVAALGVLARNYRIKRPDITFSIPTNLAWVDIQQFPVSGDKKNDKKLAEVVNLAAAKELPKNMDTANLTYLTYPNDDGQRVIFATVENKILGQLKTQISRLSFRSFTAEFSLISLLRRWSITEPSLVLHLSAGELILVLFDPEPAFLYNTAMSIKNAQKLTQSELDALSGEIRRASSYYRSLKGKPPLKQVYLSGLVSRAEAKKIESSLPVMPVPLTAGENFGLGSEYMVALGAALRGSRPSFNFLFGITEQGQGKSRLYLIILGVVAALVAALVYFTFR